MTNKLLLPAILSIAWLLTGCATYYSKNSGPEQDVMIRSSNGKPITGDVAGVQFTNQSWTMLKLKKYKDGVNVQTITPGCQPVHLGVSLNPYVFGNIIFLDMGLTSSTTDFYNGSAFLYDNDATAVVPCNN